jgi:ribulose 1,5-bisphosphate carboxylase large subunit-like protein
MKFFRELTRDEKNRCIIATFYIESNPQIGDLRDSSWNLAIGQSVGNPKIRNHWENEKLFERSSCVIYEKEENLIGIYSGHVKIGFPKINTDWEGDGISHLLCQLMGGQLDIDVFKVCRLQQLEFPDDVENKFLGPKNGITGIRKFVNRYDKPLSGAIVKPKTGISPQILSDMVKELVDGGVDFIKEDEILSNPSFCRLEDRVELISNIVNNCGRNVIYSFCINGDPHVILNRAKFVAENGGNGIHINFWCGLGVYNSVRKMNLPLFIHYQKSGDKILTDKRHSFGIDWNVLCDLAGLCGVDTIHAGMWGGYLSEDETQLHKTMNILQRRNVLPALSCGMHPGIVNITTKKFGNNFLANCGGAIHGHPGGTTSGALAMRQAIDKISGPEFRIAIDKWGYENDGESLPEWIIDF